MKVLFVSQYADPNLVGGNNNVYRQAKALKRDHGVDLEILTWPEDDTWSGPVPATGGDGTLIPLEWDYQGLKFHIIKLPRKFLKRPLDETEWQQAVELGCQLLKKINPSIVHLQHWKGLWWILESANRLSIPTVYTPHDWGMCCLRTILVKGEGGMCDGIVGIEKCAKCIWTGRNLLGKANEFLVSCKLGERLIKEISRFAAVERWLSRHEAVKQGLRTRVALNYTRAKSALSRLSAAIVPNNFAKSFYCQFGIDKSRIRVEPWYYDLTPAIDNARADLKRITFGYIGRISPEKGVSKIFEALAGNSISEPVHLVMAGEIIGEYASRLHNKYRHSVGAHSVEWMGWVPHDSVHQFYQKVDVVLIPSECIENGPLTLIEAFAYKRPVIIPGMPSARDLVREGQTGYFMDFGSAASLAAAISRATKDPVRLSEMRNCMPAIKSSAGYAATVREVYDSIEKERNDEPKKY